MNKPSVGVFGLGGCAGDQLTILNCEDELLDLVHWIDIRDFLMASSANDTACHLDIAFVDGAVASKRDKEALLRIRQRTKVLVAIGTCAVWGGVAALESPTERTDLLVDVYGPLGSCYDSMPPRALSAVVAVDYSISGCPIEKCEFLSVLANLLHGCAPLVPQYPVCAECRMRENNCLLVQNGGLCWGPVTLGGCNARCPALRVPCCGCRGPTPEANVDGALVLFSQNRVDQEEVLKKLNTFAPAGARA